MAGGGHPVGGKLDPADVADQRGGKVGQRLAHGHASGGRRVEQRQRRPLAHGEGFSQRVLVGQRGDGAVGHRHLPRPDHLVARGHAAHRAVADGDEEMLRGDARHAQHAVGRLLQVNGGGIEGRQVARLARDVARHLRRLAEQHFQIHVDGVVAEVAVAHHQPTVGGRLAQHGEGAALALAQGAELVEPVGRNRQHVALLRFVAPDLARRHARLLGLHAAQFEARAAAGAVRQFRQRVGEAAGADVVYRQDRVLVLQLPTAVDDLLRTPLDLRVAALHRGEIEVGGVGAGGHGGRRAAAEADEHAGAAELDEQRAGLEFDLVRIARGDVADAAGDHDRLVVAAHLARHFLLEGAEGAGQIRPAEFVVEGGGADRPLDHDVERRGDALGLAVGLLPRLREAGDVQVRHREAAQAGLRLGAAAGGALVADLAAGAGGRAGKRRNGGRVVVRLDLGEVVRQLLRIRIGAAGAGVEALRDGTFEHGGIVGIRHHRAVGADFVRLADHAEEGMRLRLAVDHPVGVEDLVAAMLGVRLGEHHQLDVGRVASRLGEGIDQVVDLVLRQGQAHLAVGLHQRVAARPDHVHRRQRLRRIVAEERLGGIYCIEHRFGHAVMDAGQRGGRIALRVEVECRAALDADNPVEAALAGNLRGLRRPGRDGAQARRHQLQRAARRVA